MKSVGKSYPKAKSAETKATKEASKAKSAETKAER